MRMWATCRSTKAAGFTLLEILVVLAIAGLLVSVTLPQMSGMAERVRIANERQAIVAEIENLGYRAYASGKTFVIHAAGPASAPGMPAMPLDLPEGWRLRTSKPISYGVNGVCSGGSIELVGPDRHVERYQLKPPQCRAMPVADS